MARPFTLAVFTKNRVNPAYAAARLAADRVAADAGARTLHFVPTIPDDVGQQKTLVGEALAAAPDAVVFVPVDDKKMVPDLARFADAGIPVVTCINRMEGKVISFVGSDDIAVGHTAAKALFAALGGAGGIVAIEGTPAAPTSRDRTVGLHKALSEAPGVQLAGSGVGYFQQAPAREEMARLLVEHGEIDGVWTSNDVMAFGALEALAAAGRTAKVVGVNGLPEAIEEAARRAGLGPKKVHAEYLEKPPEAWAKLLNDILSKDDEDKGDAGDAFTRIAAQRRAIFAQALGDVRRLATGAAVQARCLECAALAPAQPSAADRSLLALLMARIGL